MLKAERGPQPFHHWIGLETFNSTNIGGAQRDRKSDARSCRRAIDHDRATAAYAVFAAEVRPREPLMVTKKIGEARARLYIRIHQRAVESEGNGGHGEIA
jgi:hypothetical protein